MFKKSLLLLLAVVVVVSLSFSSSITITSPHKGDVWYKGLTYTIKWTKSGSMKSMVKIRLYSGSTKILGITDSTPNDGSFSWKVPESIADGTYYIRVKTVDNKVFDNSGLIKIEKTTLFNSSQKFITQKRNNYTPKQSNLIGAKIKISVLSPSNGTLWQEDSVREIKWNVGSSKGKSFNLYLLNDRGKRIKTIVKNYSVNGNIGVYKWNIHPYFFFNVSDYNKQYRILVRTTTGDNSGKSNPFKIGMKTVTKEYKIPAKIYWEYFNKYKNRGTFKLMAPHEKNEPGKNEAIVGFSYHYDSGNLLKKESFEGWVYRTKLFFDVSSFRGEGIITEAILHISHSRGDNCGIRYYKILEQNNPNELFDGIKLQQIEAGSPLYITNTVQKWVAYPNSNKGLILTGNDESFSHTSKSCIEYYKNIFLEIKINERAK